MAKSTPPSSTWWRQFIALTSKSWKVLLHRRKSLAGCVLAPSLAIIVLYIVFATVGVHKSNSFGDDQLIDVPSVLPPCVVLDGDFDELSLASFSPPNSTQAFRRCITLGYVPDPGNKAGAVMQEVANSVQLKHGADVFRFSSVQTMSEFMWRNPGHVEFGVVFRGDILTYELWSNDSYLTSSSNFAGKLDPLLNSHALPGRLLTLHKSIDAAIIKQFSQSPLALSVKLGSFTDILASRGPSDTPELSSNATACDEPAVPVRNQDVIGFVGSTLISLGVGVFSIVVLLTLVSEKRKRLTGKLRQMGMKESAYIASWSSVFIALGFISSLLAVVIMKLVTVSHELYLFKESSFGALFVQLFSFHVGMIGVGLILSSLFTRPALVMTVSSILFLGIWFSTLTLNIMSQSSDLYIRNGSTGCFRASDPYNGIWSPGKASHFYEFLILWFPWISYGRVTLEMYARTKTSMSFSFQDLGSSIRFLKESDVGPDIIYSAPPLANSIGSMIGLFLVSLPLCWYFSQATAGRMNGRRRWNFPLEPSYWGWNTAPADYIPGDYFAEEREKSRRESSLRVFKLSKTYKGGSALREVSVTMNHGEVFVLLGHNGAGKSTLINVLTGLTQATYGEAYFSGYSFKTDMPQVQSVCGICPQFDALWDELNAEDHLYVCAAMQGLHGKKAAKEIQRVLEAVDLLDEGKSMMTTFSGGMKRRLSVCMAVLGDNRKIIFLDEPTTGVDTVNKKRVWELVEKLKKDKIVVLTTHNMEEADALGDKIGILHQGTLKAVGSSLFLKKEFGSGYQISLLLSSAEDEREVEAIIKRILPGAKVVQSAAGNLRVSLNHNSALAIPTLLTKLKATLPGQDMSNQAQTSGSLLKEWGISNTTMEEVFLRLSARSEQQVMEDENQKLEAENMCLLCGARKAEVVTLYTQSGISVKVPNTICLACAVSKQAQAAAEPEVVAAHVEGKVAGTELKSASVEHGESHTIDVKENQQVLGSSNKVDIENGDLHVLPKSKSKLFWSQVRAVLYKNFKLNLAEKKTFIFYCVTLVIFTLLMKFFGVNLGASYSGSVCSQRSNLIDDGHCKFQDFLAGLSNASVTWPRLQQLSTKASENRTSVTPVVWYTQKGNSLLNLGFSNSTEVNFKEVQVDDFNELFISGQTKLQLNATPVAQICPSTSDRMKDPLFIGDFSTAITTFNSLFPSSGVAWSTDVSGTRNDIRITTTVRYKSRRDQYDAEKIWIRVAAPGSQNCYYYPSSTRFKDLVTLYTEDASHGYELPRGPFQAINSISNSLLRALLDNSSGAVIQTTFKSYPALRFPSSSSIPSNTFTFMFALMGMSVFFSTYVRRLVMERQSGLLQMMAVAGMQPAVYWLGNYVYDFILSVVTASIFFIVGRLVGSSFTNADPVLSAVIILVWAHALNGMSAITAGFFKSVRGASFFATIGLVVVAGACTFVNFKYKEKWSMPVGASLFPPLGMSRILFLLFTNSRRHELVAHTVVVFAGSTALFFLGVFVNQARASPSTLGMSTWLSRKSHRPETEVKGEDAETEDITLEAEKVRTAPSGTLAIKTEKLRKIYPASGGRKGGKVAVDNLTLGLEYGEIFGLLGANGAGKTTALSMLSGSLAPSEGVIEISGKRLLGKHKLSPNQLSICPQFDVVWTDLTVWTHFMFYAYLKGLSTAEARASVQAIAAELSLNGDSFHKKASSLSGGQLRRLSFGMSLIGRPSILLMDEITTGLDPASRTTIWNVVKKQSSAGRLILLTTHSMEEADTLCTRIGIMSHGRMKCLGAPLYLKNRFSNGYTLTIVTEKEDPEKEDQEERNNSIVSLIQKAAPDATLIYTWRRLHKYSVKNFDLKYLFQLLEDDSNKYHYGIREWQIEQTTLQDVFLKVSEE